MRAPRIRRATVDDCERLTELALRSKAHWGYSKAFIAACRDELTVRPARLAHDTYTCFVAERDGATQGFGAVDQLPCGTWELDALFVEPASIGTGVGRALLAHATALVREAGGTELRIHGDPHAERFYLAAGATLIGYSESGSIPGRMLPTYTLALAR
ncbi:MAG: GNAT family N-acetyltransferase [Pseudomonadota bacterium]